MPADWLLLAGAGLTGALTSAGLVGAQARRREQQLRRTVRANSIRLEQLQRAFERFAPDDVVEAIIRDGFVRPHAERREITVLFADIIGFTPISERVPPERLVRILNDYLMEMSTAITRHRGHVSKFMGDGIMALFGVPGRNPWQVMDGVRAALAMREALERYNRTLVERGEQPLSVGIGLHCGPAVAGVIDSGELADYTVIGDTVNTAARIEALAHRHPAPILISKAVRDSLDARFVVEALPPAVLKGKEQPIALYEVKGFVGPGDATH